MPRGEGKMVAQNKKAYHDYFIEDTYETGMVLHGTEIKSIRNGKVQLKDAYARLIHGEVFVEHMHISPTNKATVIIMIHCVQENCS